MYKVPLFFTVWAIIYGVVGITLQVNEVITHPAYWSLYGYIFGAVGMVIAFSIGKGE